MLIQNLIGTSAYLKALKLKVLTEHFNFHAFSRNS